MRLLHSVPFLFLLLAAACSREPVEVILAVTTDVHGTIFPYDFIMDREIDNSLAQVYHYSSHKNENGDTLFFLLDNGDFLQGQPTVYFYNFLQNKELHLSARVMNFMGYAAATVGNHDIESGPAVYDKIREEFRFPWLAANAVDTRTGEPYFEPYTVLEAGSCRIAVLGMVTPGIPYWLPKNLWPHMEFRDMVETARLWVPRIMKKERPDALIGLFHAGTDASYGGATGEYLNENATLLVAEQVPGFDAVFAGHDHRVSIHEVVNIEGDTVLVIDPGSHGRFVGELYLNIGPDGVSAMAAQNVSMKDFPPDPHFEKTFSRDRMLVKDYLEDTVTWLAGEMKGVDALFGPSSMISLIHSVQLDLTGADLSFTAPRSIRTILEEGPLQVSDMFGLYRFENMLYTMKLSGREVDAFLEHATGGWFRTMTGSGDGLLQTSAGDPGRLANPYYNFSSAAGIDYTVDLRKPPGDRVTISGLSDGRAFSEKDSFAVALNSYRGNGGGGHLTAGAGIPREDLPERIIKATDIDLRYHMMEELMKKDTLYPFTLHNWKCIPEDWVRQAEKTHRRFFN